MQDLIWNSQWSKQNRLTYLRVADLIGFYNTNAVFTTQISAEVIYWGKFTVSQFHGPTVEELPYPLNRRGLGGCLSLATKVNIASRCFESFGWPNIETTDVVNHYNIYFKRNSFLLALKNKPISVTHNAYSCLSCIYFLYVSLYI